jgi:hypothetical protein
MTEVSSSSERGTNCAPLSARERWSAGGGAAGRSSGDSGVRGGDVPVGTVGPHAVSVSVRPRTEAPTKLIERGVDVATLLRRAPLWHARRDHPERSAIAAREPDCAIIRDHQIEQGWRDCCPGPPTLASGRYWGLGQGDRPNVCARVIPQLYAPRLTIVRSDRMGPDDQEHMQGRCPHPRLAVTCERPSDNRSRGCNRSVAPSHSRASGD